MLSGESLRFKNHRKIEQMHTNQQIFKMHLQYKKGEHNINRQTKEDFKKQIYNLKALQKPGQSKENAHITCLTHSTQKTPLKYSVSLLHSCIIMHFCSSQNKTITGVSFTLYELLKSMLSEVFFLL